MTRRRAMVRSFELGLAAPAVIAMRVARMGQAGATPSAADRREMSRMVSEKTRAFTQSWFAMSARQQQAYVDGWMALARAWWTPWTMFGGGSARALAKRVQRSQASVLAHGLAPLHRTATANLRRLSKPRAR
jgi:hypothetical protein